MSSNVIRILMAPGMFLFQIIPNSHNNPQEPERINYIIMQDGETFCGKTTLNTSCSEGD